MKIKRAIISLLMCTILAESATCVLAKNFELTDDFETNIARVSSRGAMLGKSWHMSDKLGGTSNAFYSEVSAGVLQLKGAAAAPYTLNLAADTDGISEDYLFTFTMKGANKDLSYGARWAISGENEDTFYSIRKEKMDASLETNTKIVFEKYVDGEMVEQDIGSTALAYTINATVTVECKKGQIKISVADAKKSYYETVFEDSTPLKITEAEIPFAFYNFGSGVATFDEFTLRSLKPYIESGEPNIVIYRDMAFDNIENGTATFDKSVPIRRLEIIGGNVNTVSAYTEGTEVLLAKNEDFENDMWLNIKDDELYDGILIDGEQAEVSAYTDLEDGNEIELPVGAKIKLFAKIGDFEKTNVTYSEDVLSEDNGIFTSLAKGDSTITFAASSGSAEVIIKVLGDIDFYEKQDKIDEYLEKVKPVINAVNSAIAKKDAKAIRDLLLPDNENGIILINDFRYYQLDDFSSTDITRLSERMINYPEFKDGDEITLDSVKKFIQALDNEVIVGDLERCTDTEAVNKIINDNAETLGIDVKNEYYAEYKDEVMDALMKYSFDNLSDVAGKFKEAAVIGAVKGNISYKSLPEIFEKSADIIGYDTKHYDSIKDKNTFAKECFKNKDEISGIDDIKKMIDNYKETSKDSGGGSGGGSRSSSGGSSNGSSAPIILVPTVANEVKTEPVRTAIYNDVLPEHWAYESIAQLSALKIVGGYSDGSFLPDKPVSRAEFAAMVVRTFGYAYTDSEMEAFSDISSSDWFFETLMAAKQNGIMSGSANMCKPNDNISRQEMASILNNIVRQKNANLLVKNGPVIFSDEAEIADWAYVPVMQMYKFGIMNGMTQSTFAPKNNATRAQTAVVIAKLLNSIEEGAQVNE